MWEVFVNGNIQHIIPKDDSEPHIESEDCKCKPKSEYTPDNDGWIFIHDGFDGRLGVEWANELLNGNVL